MISSNFISFIFYVFSSSLFEPYCYNIICFHSILFTSIKEMEFNKLKDFIFLFGEMEWLDWRKRRAAPSLIDFINGCGWLVMSFHASSSINQPLPFHFNQSIKETQLISLIKEIQCFLIVDDYFFIRLF